jgi:hypothetical protein
MSRTFLPVCLSATIPKDVWLSSCIRMKTLTKKYHFVYCRDKYQLIKVKQNTPNKILNGYAEVLLYSINEIYNLARVSNDRHFAAQYQLNKSGHILR